VTLAPIVFAALVCVQAPGTPRACHGIDMHVPGGRPACVQVAADLRRLVALGHGHVVWWECWRARRA
jgi:hypothetical protein